MIGLGAAVLCGCTSVVPGASTAAGERSAGPRKLPLGGTETVPSPLREDVAQVLDAILIDTEPMLAALAPGPIRDAFTVVRTESAVLRDALRAPATGPVPDPLADPLTVTAADDLAAACAAR